jgi:hypothetical protein
MGRRKTYFVTLIYKKIKIKIVVKEIIRLIALL